MTSRSLACAASLLVFGCSRTTENAPPAATPDPVVDAAIAVAVAKDAAAPPPPSPGTPSPFSIIARAPTADSLPYDRPDDEFGSPMPLVQRLANGGLVVASQYARAHADGGGPLTVDLMGKGLENDVRQRPPMQQGTEGFRWVWSDDALTVISDETETARSGPRLISYKLGVDGFAALKGAVGYWSAVRRSGSVLALERTAYEIPNSSMYPKGSGYEANEWNFRPARVAVLQGAASPPVIPPGFCPRSMAAAVDGSLVIAVDKCTGANSNSGVLRYDPSKNLAAIEWFPTMDPPAIRADEVATFAAGAQEMYVAAGDRLETWNGSSWTATTPFPGLSIGSISRAPNGDLWAVIRDGSRLMKKGAGQTEWIEMILPTAPADLLDGDFYAEPTFDDFNFYRSKTPVDDLLVRKTGEANLLAVSVDATADEVLVLATASHEAFVLSTNVRAPIARLPSIPVQRAKLTESFAPLPVRATAKHPCARTYLLFPAGTITDALRGFVGDAHAGEATVQGQLRTVIYGEKSGIDAAATQLGNLHPDRVCGPAVIERTF